MLGHHLTLITSFKVLSINTVTLGLGLQHMNLKGHSSVHNSPQSGNFSMQAENLELSLVRIRKPLTQKFGLRD